MNPGDSIGHYRLIQKIGEGGMGVVWKAQDTRLERDVAIKLLSHEFSIDEKRLKRFEREAKLLASVNHPNVATIYGIDEHQDARYIAMEFIPGEDLSRRLQRDTPSVEESLSIARQITSALEATHERGVIHRDLKPANIYLTPGGGVKVLDFGIARGVDGADDGDSSPDATRPGTILGTVAFMSPEQARGKPVDAGTDLWSFGCVLYRLLTGKDAFGGATRWDRLAAVLRQEPDWNAFDPQTPAAIIGLVRDCLTKDPRERLSDARTARKTIESSLGLSSSSGEMEALRPTTGPITSDGLYQTIQRRPRLAWFAAAAIAIALMAAWVYRTTRPEPASAVEVEQARRSIAVLPFENVGGDGDTDAFTAGIHDDILNRLAKISDLRVISRTSVAEYIESSKSLEQIADELGVATILEGGVQRAGDQVRINLRLLDPRGELTLWSESFDRELSASEIFSIQSEVAGHVAVALQVTLSEEERRRIDQLPTTILEAYDAYSKGLELLYRPGQLSTNLVPARAQFSLAVELDPNFALAYAGLSRASRDHYWLGGGGEEALQAALDAANLALEIAPDLSEAHLALGTYAYLQRDYERALAELHIAEQGLPGNSELIRWKAYILRRRGGWDDALRDLRRARSLDPRDSEAVAEVAFTLLNLRRYDEATRVYEDALVLAPDYPAALIYKAMIPLLRDGSVDSARGAMEAIEQVSEIQWKYAHGWQAAICAGDFERAETLVLEVERVAGQWHEYPQALLLGWTLLLDGQQRESQPHFETAATSLRQDLQERPNDPRLHASLALSLAGLRRFDEALEQAHKAVEIMPTERDIFVGNWMLQELAWVHVMAGNTAEAVQTLDRILSVPSVWSIEALLIDPRVAAIQESADFQALVAKHRQRS